MNPEPLYLRNGLPSGIWFCTKCRHVHRDQTLAEACCVPPLCGCGQPVAPGWSLCRACLDARHAAKDRERIEKAEKLTDWTGPVFRGDDEFYSSIEDALGSSDEVPGALWPAVGKPFVQLPLDSVLSIFEDNAYEGFDTGDLKGVEELEAALKAFEEANRDLLGYEPDYTRVVIP